MTFSKSSDNDVMVLFEGCKLCSGGLRRDDERGRFIGDGESDIS